MLSLFSPRSIRHFLNCRRKQTKTEILFSYLIIFEVNNRFVAFSIDKNFQKSTEIGSQFHNLPTAGYPNPLLLPAGLYHPAVSSNLPQPASSLSFSLRPPLPSVSLLLRPYSSEVTAAASQPPLSPLRPIYPPRPPTRLAQFCVSRARRPAAPARFFSRRVLQPAPTRFFPLFLLATASPCLFPGCFSPAVSSCFRSFRPLPLNRVFLLPQRPAAAYQPPLSPLSFSLRLCPACLPSIPQSAPFSLSSRRPTYTAVFLTRLPFPITFLSPYPPAAYLASLPSVSLLLRPYFTAAASQPLLFSLRRPFRRSFSLSDKLFTIKKDVPKARLFLQAFFYSLHSSSAAKTSGLQPNTSCQIPRILRPHQTSVRINMRLPENIICR